MLNQLIMYALFGGSDRASYLPVTICMYAFLIVAGIWGSFSSYYYFMNDLNKSFATLISSGICFALAGLAGAYKNRCAKKAMGNRVMDKVSSGTSQALSVVNDQAKNAIDTAKLVAERAKELATPLNIAGSVSAIALIAGMMYGYSMYKDRHKYDSFRNFFNL